MLGVAEGAFNATIPYLSERVQFGKRIGEFQVNNYYKFLSPSLSLSLSLSIRFEQLYIYFFI